MPRQAVLQLFRVGDNRAASFQPQPAIFPGNSAPIVMTAEDGERELSLMSWGFVLPQRDRAAKRVTNARDDKVRASRFWSSSLEERRCLVPVTSFSEPKGKRPAVWHWFAINEDRPLFAFAGLWRRWKGKLKPEAEPIELNTYAFLTTMPNEIVAPVHPTRMPVMLTTQDDFDAWLNGSTDNAFSMARPYRADGMTIVARGERRDDPRA